MDHDHDREVIVTDRGGSAGPLVGVVLVIALLVGLWFFALGPGRDTFQADDTNQQDINVDIDVPSVAPDAN